jgi:uncharacterized protein
VGPERSKSGKQGTGTLTGLFADTFVVGLNDLQVAGIAAVVFLAALLRGYAGFGSSLLMVPILALVIGPKTAVAISTLLEGLATLMLVPSNFRHVTRGSLVRMGPPAVFAIPFGHVALLGLDPSLSNVAISAAVTVMAAMVWSGSSLRLPRGTGGQVGVGLTSGFLTGFGSVGVPPLVLYVLAGSGPAVNKRADVIVIAGMSQAAAIVSMIVLGVLTPSGAVGGALLAPVFFVGGVLGARLFLFSSERAYQRVALGALLISAIVLTCVNLLNLLR